MPTLYVTEPGAVVRRRSGSLVVTLDEDVGGAEPARRKRRELLEVEPHRVELIALVGRAHVTSNATRFCLERGIAVAWFRRNGDFIGRLVPELSRTADLRLSQFRIADDERRALPLARRFVAAKLNNAVAVLSALRSNRPGTANLGDAIAGLAATAARIEDASGRDMLLGLEGDAARTYFSGLRAGFGGDMTFAGRARRPPPDPVNALLSFGYVLLANALASLLEARGFDPYLGFMHAVRSGRPSLALDLMEELRHPVVDRFVLRVCNLRRIRPGHFEDDPERGGVRLTREGLKKFFAAWEAFMDAPLAGLREDISAEAAIRRQVDRLASHVRRRDAYPPLLLRRN